MWFTHNPMRGEAGEVSSISPATPTDTAWPSLTLSVQTYHPRDGTLTKEDVAGPKKQSQAFWERSLGS